MSTSRDFIAATRFGYGLHPDQRPPLDASDLMAQLSPGGDFAPGLGGASMPERAQMFHEIVRLRRANKDNSHRAELKAQRRRIEAMHRADVERRILTPVRSPFGFYERLAWFWADHFAVAGQNIKNRALVGRFEADAIRPHITGRFHDMLRASSTHPSMLLYLNQNRSFGPKSKAGKRRGRGLNENLAREIIELHTLGVDAGYTQEDVREFAELLTGLTFRVGEGELRFNKNMAEPGGETVLGETYGGGAPRIDDIFRVLDNLADHSATARHIATKLARHFTSDQPDPDLIDHIAAAYKHSGGALPAVYEAMLEHPASWASFGEKVKQPFDFVVSSLRAVNPDEGELDVISRKRNDRRRLFMPLAAMNQPVYRPPGPHGWDEAASAWITPQGLAARLEWAATLGQTMEPRIDPRGLVDTALGDAARDATRFAATKAEERWEGIAFVFASPEFNRR